MPSTHSPTPPPAATPRAPVRWMLALSSHILRAERLVLTVGTVKWHLNHLYAKLDVRGRTAALARARALGLLP